VVEGVRLTDGLYGTIVDRPSSPSRSNQYPVCANFHPLWCSAVFALHGWLTDALVED